MRRCLRSCVSSWRGRDQNGCLRVFLGLLLVLCSQTGASTAISQRQTQSQDHACFLFEPSPHHWRWPFSDDGWPDVSHFIERAACAWSRAATKSWQELSQVQVRRQHCTMSDAAQSRPKFTISSSSSSVPLMTMRVGSLTNIYRLSVGRANMSCRICTWISVLRELFRSPAWLRRRISSPINLNFSTPLRSRGSKYFSTTYTLVKIDKPRQSSSCKFVFSVAVP